MSYQLKDSMHVKNETYFHSFETKRYNKVPTSLSFSFFQQRRKDVSQRLLAEYDNVRLHNGYALFYTFTYSEKRIPKFFGVNVHDYRHLRQFFVSSGFTATLKRYFNVSLKYCVTSEFGEGKGKRGYHNNPHYHSILFLYPIDETKPIVSPECFRCLIKSYWQGVCIKSPDYKSRLVESNILTDKDSMLYGFCQEGRNVGIVSDERAILYVTKYVTKDSSTLSVERAVPNAVDDWISNAYKDNSFLDIVYDNWLSVAKEYNVAEENIIMYPDGRKLAWQFPDEFKIFYEDFKKEYRSHMIRKYNKFHKVRFRASQGLGLSVFTSDKFDMKEATIERVTLTKGEFDIVKEPICGQLYRHWFYRVEKHLVWSNTQCKMVNQSFYRPNGNLIRYKLEHFDKSLESLTQRVNDNLKLMVNYEVYKKFALMINYDKYCSVKPLGISLEALNIEQSIDESLIRKDYDDFVLCVGSLGYDGYTYGCSRRLALFMLVYAERSYDVYFRNEIHPKMDYAYFQTQSYYQGFKELRFHDALIKDNINIFDSYENHPYFKDYMSLYHAYSQFCDICSFQKGREWFAEQDHRRRCRQLATGLSTVY